MISTWKRQIADNLLSNGHTEYTVRVEVPERRLRYTAVRRALKNIDPNLVATYDSGFPLFTKETKEPGNIYRITVVAHQRVRGRR